METGVNVLLRPGTRVAVDPNCGCKTCKFCLDGKYHFCRKNMAVGVKRDGGFARYCVGEYKIILVLSLLESIRLN